MTSGAAGGCPGGHRGLQRAAPGLPRLPPQQLQGRPRRTDRGRGGGQRAAGSGHPTARPIWGHQLARPDPAAPPAPRRLQRLRGPPPGLWPHLFGFGPLRDTGPPLASPRRRPQAATSDQASVPAGDPRPPRHAGSCVSPAFRPEKGAVPVSDTRSSQNTTRGVSEAQAQPRLSDGDSAPLPRLTKDCAGCAHLLATQKSQSPGLRKWQPFQFRGRCGRNPPIKSRGRERFPQATNESLGKRVSASSWANPERGRGGLRRDSDSGVGAREASIPDTEEAGPGARRPIEDGSRRARARDGRTYRGGAGDARSRGLLSGGAD